ncbi:MAG: GNAT family N-acetyltransferase [Flavobacteriales bacterium]|nr:GNAT family N-acetyltransferase [Flavobacteriales bacterium]
MDSNVSITTLSAGDFSDLLKLADALFGHGYLNKSELQSYLHDPLKSGLVARTSGVIAGFLCMQTCDMDEMMSLAQGEQTWFNEQFSNNLPLGVLKTIGVSEPFKNRGIGTALTRKSIEMLGRSSRCIVSICWDQKEDTPFSRVMEKCGMKMISRVAEFWSMDSLNKNYKCHICGSPPCRCDGLIYQCMLG